jgi:O-antigen biosynthesis protein WbqP
MKRLFDLILSFIALFLFFVPMIIISIFIFFTSNGPILYFSRRVGQQNIIFNMPKFRSMKIDTPVIATHLIAKVDDYLSPIGGFLRRYSLDELPQIFSIIKGDMSFVGPRPALFNQYDLIELRKKNGISNLIPGLTGWAQVNGRDELSIQEKVKLEVEYMHRKSFWFELKILWMTVLKVFTRHGISH